MNFQLHHGNCIDVLRTMNDNSVDAIVTDPPYGLKFMGRKWDYDVPSIELWAECLRVLKPGGHLLAFAGTRTQHRMAVRIEDAGFEIRDMIAWVYGSGFPKSLDVSKAIDKAAGAVREVVGFDPVAAKRAAAVGTNAFGDYKGQTGDVTATATDAARLWQGWGTALKPALETVTFASKPYTQNQERDIILSNLIRLEARLWLLSSASAAEENSTSNPSEYGAACGIAQWSAEETTSTRAALCDPMGMSLFELATTTSLSIVSSWRRTLAESWSDGSTSTIETRSSTTTDWKTLKFSLSQITAESIIKACSLPGGFSANATTAESHFNASLSLLQSIRTLSATERAMSQAQHEHQGAGVKPNLDPCIMARKPLVGTVAANVLAHGTGALNIDGCRVPAEKATGWGGSGSALYEGGLSRDGGEARLQDSGRWPANLIHDGSDEVVAGFSETTSGGGPKPGTPRTKANTYGDPTVSESAAYGHNTGSAARFFYCAKASRKDRDDGLDAFEIHSAGELTGGRAEGSAGLKCPRAGAGRTGGGRNTHPTVKPTDLMRYLCRLVTPPGGVVLDPFTGSGTTGKAALLEGFQFIGIEREQEYIEIASARINSVANDNLLMPNQRMA